jgi:hypothetical protein
VSLKGISTENLEKRIEDLLMEIEPPEEGRAVSFGVNAEKWVQLREAVLEYVRICRNGRAR